MSGVDLFPITVDDMLAEVKRELLQRAKVYPRLVATGKLSAEKAGRQTRVMEALADKLKRETGA
jgi:hypothetical protein